MNPPVSGATGASPTPTPSGGSVATGSSPASNSSVSNASTPSTNSSATTKKIDYGMRPTERTREKPVGDSDSSDGNYNESWWQQHGPAIFEHKRFKELAGYKKSYEEVAPLKDFVESFGGMDSLKEFDTYLGPVWRHLTSQGQQGVDLWNQLLPILQSVISGKGIPTSQNSQIEAVEVDPFEERLKPLQDELKQLRETEKQRQDREKQEAKNSTLRTQKENVREYEKLLAKKLQDPKNPVDAKFKATIAEWVITHIGRFMPKDQNGQKLNPLRVVSPEAFNQMWDEVIKPRLTDFQTITLNNAKKSSNGGGPTLPDTRNGLAPGGSVTPTSTKEKIQRFSQGLQRIRVG